MIIMGLQNIKEIYDTYKNYSVVFNKNVINSLELIANKISIKCDTIQIPALLVSSCFCSAKVILKINKDHLEQFKRDNFLTTIRYTFYVQDLMEQLSFYVTSKIVDFDRYDSENPNLFLITLEFTRVPPRIFIEILGEYILQQEKKNKRAAKRINLPPGTLESYIFKDGEGKKCTVTEISISSAKVLVSGLRDNYLEDATVLLLMKSPELEGLGEMIGYIKRVEEIGNSENLLSIIILFDQKHIPPAYKKWVLNCIKKVV